MAKIAILYCKRIKDHSCMHVQNVTREWQKKWGICPA